MIDAAFRTAYAAARQRRGLDGPVFVLLANELVVHSRGERRVHAVRPPLFHRIKEIAHVPVALYMLHLTGAVNELRRHVDAVSLEGLPEAIREDCNALLRGARSAMALPPGTALPPDFFFDLGRPLRRLRLFATKLQLMELDRVVSAEWQRLDMTERDTLQVVVTGVHQARDRSFGVQYFSRRIAGGAPAGERVIYAEGVGDEATALDLVTAQRLDQEVAVVFFGEPARLQQDLLGDVTEELLAQHPCCAALR